MKKKHKPQRMKYEQRLEIEAKYGSNAVCGYARNFHKSGEYMTARCSLIDGRCKRELPMEMGRCGVYLDWLKVRRDKMMMEDYHTWVENTRVMRGPRE